MAVVGNTGTDAFVSTSPKGTLPKVNAFSHHFIDRLREVDIIALLEAGTETFVRNFVSKLNDDEIQWCHHATAAEGGGYNGILWKNNRNGVGLNLDYKTFVERAATNRESWIARHRGIVNSAVDYLQHRSVAIVWEHWVVVNVHAPHRRLADESKEANLQAMVHVVELVLDEHPDFAGVLFCGDMNYKPKGSPDFLELETLRHSHKVLGFEGARATKDVMWAVSVHRKAGGWDDGIRLDEVLHQSFKRAAGALVSQDGFSTMTEAEVQKKLQAIHYSDHRIMLYKSSFDIDALIEALEGLTLPNLPDETGSLPVQG
jgi:endonuclease/exonuclease/phosphatase family metal-dependent hydrolase